MGNEEGISRLWTLPIRANTIAGAEEHADRNARTLGYPVQMLGCRKTAPGFPCVQGRKGDTDVGCDLFEQKPLANAPCPEILREEHLRLRVG
jgi:hypothetical protein